MLIHPPCRAFPGAGFITVYVTDSYRQRPTSTFVQNLGISKAVLCMLKKHSRGLRFFIIF
ncbi:hypothetical protein VK70_16770 [Paenibacillus durus ATCC 35681]|uniref:Uncharacterized protein n=1 Tax=Paenibacillus durus ATCC 35681 TaxID=1333534 RepID=A0A0F7FCF3_PAEDU|nr:hypothetical protein VK70_16770 [Paenibacillus durus ATCC 35681]